MSKLAETYDLFYYDGQEGHEGAGDFSGPDSVLSTEQRVAFLERYSNLASDWFHDPRHDRFVVADHELRNTVSELKPSPLPAKWQALNDWKYATTGEEIQGWTTYYSGARISDGELNFADGELPPVPCAKYVFEAGQAKCDYIEMELKIDPAYRTEDEPFHYVGSMGRTIELRHETLPLVRIKWYTTGYVYASGKDIYHPSQHELGRYAADEWIKLAIRLDWEARTYAVCLSGCDAVEGISFMSDCACLDQLFFDGGMQAGAPWSIRNIGMLIGRSRIEPLVGVAAYNDHNMMDAS